ncbi:copper resistance CopC/CopD family protein [Demequina lignilytica]|uniref:Copper resistance protein CopC n=1 Tax=Demequina lignilytica TaxID=3051663 RepID=A0AB35MK10_9MICO|nr:copper resistance protein CopC [Demequina sp. SYSU T0a273]MDN4484145.1 copper resistance protein CopC [Demequina sp. SYSU T0a273]
MSLPTNVPTRTGAGRRALPAALAVALAALLALLAAAPAQAHTQLDASDPADGSTLTEPVERIVLTYSLPVTPLGDAVVVTGPDGPVDVEVTQSDDGLEMVATPVAALDDGEFTVEWTVAAQDGHPLDGTFAFAVAGTEPSPSATPSASASAAPTPTASASPSPSASMSPMPEDHEEDAGGVGGDTFAEILARAGSAIALWALLVGAGALAFAAIALRGTDRIDEPRVIAGVRWCGALVLGGLALRLVGRSELLDGGSLADGLTLEALDTATTGSVAWVLGLQAAGALLMLLGAWRSARASWLAVIGVLLAGAGHVLGGHSNTAEPRWLVLTADVAHLAAAAIWVGGVVTLASVLLRRRREGRPLDAARMGSRFGVVAAGAFVVVGAAGVALTWAIVDELSDLWATTWGIVLLVKVAVVLVVGAIGAYTHFSVVPRLNRAAAASPDAGGEHDATHLRRAAVAEAWLFAAVVIATAVLVASTVHM